MLVGQSLVIERLRQQIARVARTPFTVLIEGESGAGKELVARDIHARSVRHRGPFVAVNCAALVETLLEAELFGIEERTATGVRGRRGKFELADHGTLFLDEVGDLSATAQAKLLRVLQDMTVERVGGCTPQVVDTRVIAATNRRLAEMVASRTFRADLYYRLSGVEIEVPPLRARPDDVPLLVEHFLRRYDHTNAHVVTPEAYEVLMAYGWPGNVRELARVIERALALASSAEIAAADLPDRLRQEHASPVPAASAMREDTLRAWSSRYVRAVLHRCRGNKRRACDILDISYHTLQAHLEYGLQSELRGLAAATEVASGDSAAAGDPMERRPQLIDRAGAVTLTG
jgi:transcriptional regulator with PAS, ATPase and Fis domain